MAAESPMYIIAPIASGITSEGSTDIQLVERFTIRSDIGANGIYVRTASKVRRTIVVIGFRCPTKTVFAGGIFHISVKVSPTGIDSKVVRFYQRELSGRPIDTLVETLTTRDLAICIFPGG